MVTPRSVHASLTPKIASSASSTPSKVLTVAPGGTARAVTRATPFGYGPSDLRSAYSLGSASANRGAGQTIAIVDAYDHPNAASDLANFRSTYGLPAANFRKVDQRGGTNYPSTDTGWAEEISLDLDMASAIAPNANILLVEGDSASFEDLGSAVDQAAAMGATQISNSYGGEEVYGSPYASDYNHPGIAITASMGDDGYGCAWFWEPASRRTRRACRPSAEPR